MKINTNDKEKIVEVLTSSQSQAKARTVDYRDILRIVGDAEHSLAAMQVPKKSRCGVKAVYFENVNCNAYSKKAYFADSTYIVMIRGGKNWYLTDCYRMSASTGKTTDKNLNIFFTPAQKEASMNRLFDAAAKKNKVKVR